MTIRVYGLPKAQPRAGPVYECFVDEHVPSLNEINRIRNASKWSYTRRGRALAGMSLKAMRGNWARAFEYRMRPEQRASGPRTVELYRIMAPGQRKYDDDNLAGGLKSARDALADVGLIIDDRPSCARFEYAQRRGAVEGLEVVIYDGMD